MIDFIKCELPDSLLSYLYQHPLLEFETKVNNRTGELGSFASAYYKNLLFKVYHKTKSYPQGRITLEGSLHKFWNNGKHNFNDFDLSDLEDVLKNLKNKFNITPQDCSLKQFEVGVNINPPEKTSKVLNSCIFHKTRRFENKISNSEGNYLQAPHRNYYIKIYDKRKQYHSKGYELRKPILRFEIKYFREKLCKTIKKVGQITLADVLKRGLRGFIPELLKEWNNILFYDYPTLDQTSYKFKYSNPYYWINLKYNNFKYHRKRMNKIIDSNPDNLKEKIKNEIHLKSLELCRCNPTQIKPLSIITEPVI